MSANAWGLLINVVLAVATVVGAVAAVAAARWAKRSNEKAESARWVAQEGNRLARDANSHADKSNQLAYTALDQAQKANRLATDANEIATRANGYAEESNEIARSAVDQTKEAALQVLWNEAILALENVRLVDLRTTDMGPLLANLNGRLSLLGDALNADREWPMIHEWLTEELQIGLRLASDARRELGEAGASSAELSPVETAALHRPFRNWGYRLMRNLRALKAQGYLEDQLKAVIHDNKQVLAGKAKIPDVVGQ